MERKKTKVLFVLPEFVHGGAEVLVRNMLLSGFDDKYQVAVCVTGNKIGSFMEKDILTKGVEVYYFGNSSKNHFSTIYKLYKLIRKFRPQILHTHLNSLGHAMLLAVINRVPVRIHTVHNVAEREGRAILRILSRIAFRFCGFVPIGISKTIAQTIKDYYNIQYVPVINNGIPVEEYKLQNKTRFTVRSNLSLTNDNFVCIHVGRFFKQKNHKNLLHAFALVLEACPDAVLLLVGDGELKKETQELAELLDISSSLKFLGERADVPALLSASDLFVFSSDYEGLPLAVIEAMAAGLPVVSTDVGGMRDLVTSSDNGYLVNTAAPEELAEGILKIALNPLGKAALSQHAVNHVKINFHIRNTVLGHEQLYLESLAAAQGSPIS